MKSYEERKHLRISDVSANDLNMWILDEIVSLSNDFGNKLDNDEILHIGRRLYEKLTTAYRSWYVADVHAAFQTGLSGAYGSFRKVTVIALFQFLKMAQNQMSSAKALQAENEKHTDVFDKDKYNTPVSEFLVWCRVTLDIDVNRLHPDYDPSVTRQISPVIAGLTNDYVNAKQRGRTVEFATELRRKYAD